MASHKPIPSLSVHQIKSFWARVLVDTDNENACWEWTGCKNHGGYGITRIGGSYRAHRIAFTLTKGPIPDGLTVDHLCRNRRCCNPAHLEAVTIEVNVARAPSANGTKTHCPKGHPYTRFRKDRRRRECWVCIKAARAAKKAWRSGKHKNNLTLREKGF